MRFVGCDDGDGSMYGSHCFIQLRNAERHFIEFPQQIVRKFNVCFVNLVDEQDHLFVRGKSLTQNAHLDVGAYVGNVAAGIFGEPTVIQPLNDIVGVQPFLRCRG